MNNNENQITYFARTTFRNQKKKFGIKIDDRRRHTYLIGKTGMGKTATMKNMAIQDIKRGNGVAFVDPHGEAAEDLLNYIPSERINDVVYFNPADIEYPIAFNVMEKVNYRYRHLVAGGLMGVFKKVWPDVWSARMEYILNNSILALLEYPDSTLLGINRMLADPEYRKKVINKITDPVVKSFWVNEFARYSQRYEVEATAAIQNKIGQFISNPLIRNIIGQVKSSINMRKVMDEGKILIVNLSKGRTGEDNSRLLGALLITKLQLAAMSRVDTPEEERNDFYLYVDEFQNFATEAFASILSEARKYHLALILGHQYIAQMEEEVRDAVFGNVGTLVCFRVGAEDAEYLEKEFIPEFNIEDLVNLGKYNIYLKLMVDGVAGRPFSAETLSPFEKPETSYVDKIIKVSRERYGVKSEEVEEKIKKWTGFLPDAAPASKSSPELHDAVCSRCGKETKVPFKPIKGKPVYCKSCLKKVRKEAKQSKDLNKGNEKESSSESEKENKKQENREKEQGLSLKKAITEKETSFFSKKKGKKKKKSKKDQVNLKELRQVLEESLSEGESSKKESNSNSEKNKSDKNKKAKLNKKTKKKSKKNSNKKGKGEKNKKSDNKSKKKTKKNKKSKKTKSKKNKSKKKKKDSSSKNNSSQGTINPGQTIEFK